jgi:hypothetical protein
MIRKISSGEYRLYSRKVNPQTKRRRNLGTFKTRAAAEQHEREVQYFKRHWGRCKWVRGRTRLAEIPRRSLKRHAPLLRATHGFSH